MKIYTVQFGTIKYYNKDNKLHHLDGPAIIYKNGNKCWYVDGVLHRLDGPAMEVKQNNVRWFYKGKFIPVSSQEEFTRYIKLLAFI